MDAKRLEDLLKEKGIKQTWIAEKLNVSASVVNQWVKGTKDIPEDRRRELKSLLN